MIAPAVPELVSRPTPISYLDVADMFVPGLSRMTTSVSRLTPELRVCQVYANWDLLILFTWSSRVPKLVPNRPACTTMSQASMHPPPPALLRTSIP